MIRIDCNIFLFLLLFYLETGEIFGQFSCDSQSFDISASAPANAKRKDYVSWTCERGYGKAYKIAPAVNGINHFCVAVAMTPAPNDKTFQLKSNAAKDCYKKPGSPEPVFHAAGQDPHWALLNHLTKFRAQSFQRHNDFPFVDPTIYSDLLNGMTVNSFDFQPGGLPRPFAPNPYFIEVTGIKMKGELLQNFLHIRVFANMSVGLGKDQLRRDHVFHGVNGENTDRWTKGTRYTSNYLPNNLEKQNYATGRISGMVMMVVDHDGFPVGDFSTPVPCTRTCRKYSHDVYYGDRSNSVPCSYTPPFASSHPSMFVYDADPGRYCPKVGNKPDSPDNSTEDPRLRSQTARKEGVREIHATWSFSHDSCNFASALFIQTLIFEDVETVWEADDGNTQNPKKMNFLFGWSAQSNVIVPTRESLGAPDFVHMKYFKERDSRYNEIDCHVHLFDAEKVTPFTFTKFIVPHLGVVLGSDYNYGRLQSKTEYHAIMSKNLEANRAFRYFGQDGPNYPGSRAPSVTYSRMCRPLRASWQNMPGTITAFLLSGNKDQFGIRCPCPAHASEQPLANRTADPGRLHGRLIHASHMAIAYMFLTPIACFVVRYYKETFVTVFCFQEYWWFMWHVICLIVACLFNIGAITSISRKKQGNILYSNNLLIHIVLGAISIFVFYMEIITGFFRVSSPKKRLRQIFTHWLIGTLNNACAVMSMFAMAWVDQSGFSCNVAFTMGGWVLFVVTCYGVMEYNMRKTDKRLKLAPRRSYLPPPIKRLFTKEPPGRHFRMSMLIFFVIGLVIIQGFISYFIWNVDHGMSCEEEYRTAAQQKATRIGGGGGGGGGPNAPSAPQAVNPSYYG